MSAPTGAYGADVVGILTGDVKVNPSGRVLVMIIEILRNMFYTRGLSELAREDSDFKKRKKY